MLNDCFFSTQFFGRNDVAGFVQMHKVGQTSSHNIIPNNSSDRVSNARKHLNENMSSLTHCLLRCMSSYWIYLLFATWYLKDAITVKRKISRKTLQFVFYERGAVLIFSLHCVNLFNWFHFGLQMWVSVKSLHSSGRGSLNVNTKDHRFLTDWISVHSVHTIEFTIGGGTTCGSELV